MLFADLRGFTAFAEAQDADTVMQVLREFHAAMGALIFRFEGTLERFTGDGMMVFFNDPDPMPDHAREAVRLGLAMVEATDVLRARWPGGPLGLAVGIGKGMATVGAIGFEGRLDYAAIGHVTNVAARLCAAVRRSACRRGAGGRGCLGRSGLRGPERAGRVARAQGFSQPVGCRRLRAPSPARG